MAIRLSKVLNIVLAFTTLLGACLARRGPEFVQGFVNFLEAYRGDLSHYEALLDVLYDCLTLCRKI